MNKVTSTALLGMLALANAGLDYSAVCVFLDVDPFGTFSPNNFFAGLVAIAQSLLLIILPWVASEKIAAGEKGPAACAIIGSLFVAMAGAFLRATTEAASTTTSVSGEVVSGLSIDGMAFVLIMAGIALGEAIAAFLIKSLDIRAEAEALQAEIERMRIIDEDIATAARVALAAGRQSIAAAKGSCEQVFQQLVAKSDDSHNCFIGFVDEIEAQRKAEREQFVKLSAEFEARIAKKYPHAIAAEQKAPTAEDTAMNEAAANSPSKGGDAAADVDAAAANPTGTEAEVDAEIGGDASETVGDPSAGDTPNNIVNTENSASDQAKAA